MDEILRENFKVSRDFNSRGASIEQVRSSLAQRAPDAERYVNVQKNMADIQIHLECQSGYLSETKNILCSIVTHGFVFPAVLSRAMSSISLISHTLEQGKNVGDLELRIDASEVNELEVTALADYLLPNFQGFFDSTMPFPSGNLGIETLVIFLALDERRGQVAHA